MGRAEARPYMGDDVIVGMGVDLEKVERIRTATKRHGEEFLLWVVTAEE
jgi:phosphopantetheinyl transferase (holo-ACP synthase)